jgi:hypothetical protein
VVDRQARQGVRAHRCVAAPEPVHVGFPEQSPFVLTVPADTKHARGGRQVGDVSHSNGHAMPIASDILIGFKRNFCKV